MELLEAKAFLTVDANLVQVHDSEPLIAHRSDFDGVAVGRRKLTGSVDNSGTWGFSAASC
ncbi:hypothetical protein CQ14_05870 [Bradyrhizobium lablabi]|uniref:Uncharacterized protein n=1 Tax=Bradyrhizobium lablabi TaxID=722472 RepID=A0A0R3MZ48_9BRAD|nr:hypothetical protein CQ14_05870 [Bradyrhizobium lablabi]